MFLLKRKKITYSLHVDLILFCSFFSTAYCDIISLRNTIDPINMDISPEINLTLKHAKKNHVKKSL